MQSNEYFAILYVMQIISIYNAIIQGWKVKKIGDNRYELYKKMTTNECNQFNLDVFVNNLINI